MLLPSEDLLVDRGLDGPNPGWTFLEMAPAAGLVCTPGPGYTSTYYYTITHYSILSWTLVQYNLLDHEPESVSCF